MLSCKVVFYIVYALLSKSGFSYETFRPARQVTYGTVAPGSDLGGGMGGGGGGGLRGQGSGVPEHLLFFPFLK